ncbi:zincin [Periconia macrospinosa]|uniref:Zincin n=1 Tax=Periconia macrospinosa TaxID=97972 RepID=A0A2V1DUU3_9PLEO|nr:zincin [Periconia macrospinosa]
MVLPKPLLTSVGVFLSHLTLTTAQAFDCGTDTSHASEHFLSTISSLHSPQTNGSPAARAASILTTRDTTSQKDNNTAITIDTIFHIVATPSKKSTITNDMPSAQLDALNAAYNPYDITFNLVNVTWTTNEAWAVGASPADAEMKKSLRQGTYRTLNLYFQTDLTGGVLGRCTLPSPIANGRSDPSVYLSDGCNVNANTMPGGDLEDYNAGKTAVHEAGHWLGLLHTFEGNSCDGPGDYIDDTPPEREATDGCPVDPVKSTCQGKGDADPIHNFMDYSSDACYEGFTKLQHDRMHFMWNLYRDGN